MFRLNQKCSVAGQLNAQPGALSKSHRGKYQTYYLLTINNYETAYYLGYYIIV